MTSMEPETGGNRLKRVQQQIALCITFALNPSRKSLEKAN